MALVIRNLQRKFKTNDLMMEAKGFDAYSKEVPHIHIPIYEWVVPIVLVVILVVTYGLKVKGWTL